MKRFTAGKAKRKKSSEDTSKTHYSTDPKDLPDGILVGSMSVAYVPPDEAEQPNPVSPKKGKKLKHTKSPKYRRNSPLLTRQIIAAAAAARKLDSTEAPEFQSPVNIEPSSPLRIRRRNWATKELLTRSCSVDGLDDLAGEMESKRKSHHTPEFNVRRCSTESENISIPPGYHRVVSLATEARRRAELQSHRLNNSSGQHQPIFTSFMSQVDAPSRPQRALHEPRSVEHLLETLQSAQVDVNLRDEVTGDAPIHSIIRRKKKDRAELLMTLLINSSADVNLQNRRNMTALHSAIEAGCEMCAKIALVFGADINIQGCNQFTPLDLVINSGSLPSIETTLLELGAMGSTQKLCDNRKQKKIPRLFSFAQKMRPPKKEQRVKPSDKISEYINSRGVKKLYNELEINVMRRLSISATIGGADDAFALVLQQRELALYNRTLPKPKKKNSGTAFGLRGGSRILCLDGGGIKGLVQLEALIQLEERTQCKITDLFDWIVGTSTGGVIALAMVYGKKSLVELRQLYFLLKNRIFMKSRYGYGYNSETLEEILKDYLTTDIKMSDVRHPKVLIAAVNKATTNLELHFFNNCLDDDYTDYPVWKVARYTSAAPMFFSEYENYVDGGVICNNPTDYGLTAIQNYCRLTGNNIPIAVVVSIGTGSYPPEKIGSVDAQDALFFGKQWLNPGKLLKQTQNLLSLLSTALVESEMVAENSKSRCQEQDIPFFRFSPKFDEPISAGETDSEKLLNMVIKTKLNLKERERELEELVKIFLAVAENSKDLDEEAIPEGEEVSDQPREEPLSSLAEEDEHSPRPNNNLRGTRTEAEVQEVANEENERHVLLKEVPEEHSLQQEVSERHRLEQEEQEIEIASEKEKEPEEVDITPADFKDEDEVFQSPSAGQEKEPGQQLQREFSENFLFESISSALSCKERESFLTSYSETDANTPNSSSPDRKTPDTTDTTSTSSSSQPAPSTPLHPASITPPPTTPPKLHTPLHQSRSLSSSDNVVFKLKAPTSKNPTPALPSQQQLQHKRTSQGSNQPPWGLSQDTVAGKHHPPVCRISNTNLNHFSGARDDQPVASPAVLHPSHGASGGAQNTNMSQTVPRQKRSNSKVQDETRQKSPYSIETLV